MSKFDDRCDCRWSYRVGAYRSFHLWPTREDVVDHLEGHDREVDAEIIQVHGANCFCDL
jgi:hypothetical protein